MSTFVDASGAVAESPARPRRRRGSGIRRLDPRAREAVDVILVRLRVEGALSYRDIEELFKNPMNASTIMRRVRRKLADLEERAGGEAES